MCNICRAIEEDLKLLRKIKLDCFKKEEEEEERENNKIKSRFDILDL